MSTPLVVLHEGRPHAVLRIVDDFGFRSLDLVGLPRRLSPEKDATPLLGATVDARRVEEMPTLTALLATAPTFESWLGMSGRTLARLSVAFLLAEDPQRRLEARKAATLMHQVSLVEHVMSAPSLRKVLIADEVGLGKTIEAGLLIRRVLAQRPGARVLYLSPARLVANVVHEFREKLDLDARRWIAGADRDARIEADQIVVASIHRAVFGENLERVASSGPWDVLIVDECHHLSDWGPAGGKPNQGFRLVRRLIEALPADGRLILMSGTPHQGSEERFRNLLGLLSDRPGDVAGAAGKVIYRTKERVRDWHGRPLFPSREIRPATVVSLGDGYEAWYFAIGELYDRPGAGNSAARAATWAKGQALQWAASSVQAGLGFLTRLGIRRLGWTAEHPALARGVAALRPYRGGAVDEPIASLYERIRKQIGAQQMLGTGLDDEEEAEEDTWRPDPVVLGRLIDQGITLLSTPAAHAKWERLAGLIDAADGEKCVLFAQPVETVSVVARFLESRYGEWPALIIGNQSDEERAQQVRRFQSNSGPRFLVSSRAGGEGLNLQRSRRLIHLDVPWNPMELEQRVGRVHRFGSRRTIIVDTVVAAGSREVDMFRIAREKLALIAAQLDPEEFETLFSRVMSLVPPKELEDVLGHLPAGPFTSTARNEIGRLVAEGHAAWKSFDDTYRTQAESIRAASSGEATWSDLAQFLIRFCGAEPAPNVAITAFDYRDDEVVAVDAELPALKFADRLYVCGDTGGIQPEPVAGQPVLALGLNTPGVRDRLAEAFAPDRPAGAACIRRPPELGFLGPSSADVTSLLVFLRQTVRQESGQLAETALGLHVFFVPAAGEPVALTSADGARVVRTCVAATRTRDLPPIAEMLDRLSVLEPELGNSLRRPASDEVAAGIRHVVWPVAALLLVP